MAKLIQSVYLGGTLYRPGDEVPAELAKLAANPKLWDVEKASEADPVASEYDDMTVEDLRAEIALRNERGAEVKPEGNKKADLVAALVADDRA